MHPPLELRRAEGLLALLRARQALKKKYGKAYVGFSEPIHLDQYLTRAHANWRAEPSSEEKPPWFSPLVDEIANEIMVRINRCAMVSPVAVIGTALLSTPQRALAENELLELIDIMLQVLSHSSYCPEIHYWPGNG